ncbi:MAG: hypothetical protein H0V18_13100 [Pyrinomonadaceae bacterium]|nr:hypothetical protein [Pyrinomonadaceae bacterium]
MREQTLRFDKTSSLVGVVTDPREASPNYPAIILLGAGIVHRVGPHRLYVKLARKLAAMGFVVFRFDFSGIGDSKVREDNLPFEQSAVAETQEAMDWLRAARNVDRFVLMAVCSGAGFSFRTACCDRRVIGVSLINAAGHRWGTSEELNRTLVRHYWRMLRSRSFRIKNWRKLITLNFDSRTIMRATANQIQNLLVPDKESPEAENVASAFESLIARGVRVLIVYSEGDEGWDYYQVFLRSKLRRIDSNSHFGLEFVHGANHTFTLLSHQRDLFNIVGRWVEHFK